MALRLVWTHSDTADLARRLDELHDELDGVCICGHVQQLHADSGLCVSADPCDCEAWRPV